MANAATPEAFVAELPPERSELIAHVRALVNAHIPSGYRERVAGSMLVWEVPLEDYPETYNGQPLQLIALASQKNHCALYLQGCYASPEAVDRLRASYAAAGKKLDMGKSCLRFKTLDQLHEPAIAETVAAFTPAAYVALHERSRTTV